MYTLRTAVVLAVASLGAAQSLAGLPTCAVGCVTSALPASCNLDPKCICESTSFIADIACCVSTACDAAGQEGALTYARGICNPVGVTNLPTAATCAPGTGNGTSSTASETSGSASATSSGESTSTSASATGTSASGSATSSGASAGAGSASSSAPAAATGSSGGATGPVVYVKSVGLGLGVGLLGVAAFL